MPVKEHLFPTARLRSGPKHLHAEQALVQVEWTDTAERFDLRSADVVATAVADVEVPANDCPIAIGQVWEMDVEDGGGATRLEVLSVRLVEVRPGPSRFRRKYTWQFLVVRKPGRDPYHLFPRPARPAALGDLADDGGDILGDLKRLLASEIAGAAVARFNAEGGFRFQEA
jgi:hypothetical protein